MGSQIFVLWGFVFFCFGLFALVFVLLLGSKILKKHFLDPRQKCGIQIQDPRSKMLKKMPWTILIGSKFLPWIQERVFSKSKILYLGSGP